MASKTKSAFADKKMLDRAIKDSFIKLNPKTQVKNPVMLLVYISAILTTELWIVSLFGLKDASSGYTFAIAVILWFTVLYANFAEAIAEGRGKAQADGSIIEVDGKKYGCELPGQQYNDESHMWGRIMNVDVSTYKDENGKTLMYASPSNLSPASEEYKALVEERIEMLRKANPDMDETAIPIDLVTCSGSGLDPHISPAAAEYQVARIAKANDMTEDDVRSIIDKCTSGKFLGVFG